MTISIHILNLIARNGGLISDEIRALMGSPAVTEAAPAAAAPETLEQLREQAKALGVMFGPRTTAERLRSLIAKAQG